MGPGRRLSSALGPKVADTDQSIHKGKQVSRGLCLEEAPVVKNDNLLHTREDLSTSKQWRGSKERHFDPLSLLNASFITSPAFEHDNTRRNGTGPFTK